MALKPKIGKNYPVPVASEERKTPHKQRIRELIKKPKEKFLTNNQELYWNILGENQITLCFGPAGVGKSYIAMKRAIDLLHDEDNKYEKIIIVRPAVEAEEKLGSLPGGLEEKLDPYIYPSYYLLNKIIGKEARERMKDEGYIEVLELEEIPEDPDAFMAKHGAPVELVIIDANEHVIATHDEIGWWDDGEYTDELRDITLNDINYLLRELDGYIDIEIDEDYGPVIYEGRVVLTVVPDDFEDWDTTLDDGLEEE